MRVKGKKNYVIYLRVEFMKIHWKDKENYRGRG